MKSYTMIGGRGGNLASFTQRISIGHSFSLLSSVLLYDYITISVSVDGHLVCIHFGAIINASEYQLQMFV